MTEGILVTNLTVVTDRTVRTAGILVTDLAVVTNRTVRTEGILMTVVTDGTVSD